MGRHRFERQAVCGRAGQVIADQRSRLAGREPQRLQGRRLEARCTPAPGDPVNLQGQRGLVPPDEISGAVVLERRDRRKVLQIGSQAVDGVGLRHIGAQAIMPWQRFKEPSIGRRCRQVGADQGGHLGASEPRYHQTGRFESCRSTACEQVVHGHREGRGDAGTEQPEGLGS